MAAICVADLRDDHPRHFGDRFTRHSYGNSAGRPHLLALPRRNGALAAIRLPPVWRAVARDTPDVAAHRRYRRGASRTRPSVVLYRPPFHSKTWLLWGAPIILLTLGFLVFARILKSRMGQHLSEDEIAL